MWDTTTGTNRFTLKADNSAVNAVAIDPQGVHLATASHDGSIRVWEASTGRSTALTRVDGPAYACTWTPYDSTIAVAGRKGLYVFQYRDPARTTDPLPVPATQNHPTHSAVHPVR